MGVNILVETLDGAAHPTWDSLRYSGDSEVLTIIEANGGTVQHPSPEDYDPWTHGDDVHYRPADFGALARAPWPEFNTARWALLQRILSEQPEYWLRISY